MRADAQANRRSILTAARDLYSERGMIVPFSSIAERAGVGIATLYRHFPTPADLHIGLAESLRDEIAKAAEAAMTTMENDPELGWREFVETVATLGVAAFAPQIVEALTPGEFPADIALIRADILTSTGEVLRRAQDAHLAAPEISSRQLLLGIAISTRPLARHAQITVPGQQEWMLQTFLLGLRPVR